jgi:hypothetical protein
MSFEGWSMRVKLDEETLGALPAPRMQTRLCRRQAIWVYQTLSARLTVEKKERDFGPDGIGRHGPGITVNQPCHSGSTSSLTP